MEATADSTTPTTAAPSEAPPPAAPSEAKPLADAVGIFDAPVNEAKKATPRAERAAPDAGQTKPAGAKGTSKGKKKGEPTQEEQEAAAAKANAEALGLVTMAEQIWLLSTKKRYAPFLPKDSLDALLETQKWDDKEKQMIAEPLAEIMVEEGVKLPPEVRLLLAGAVVILPKLALLDELKVRIEKETGVSMSPPSKDEKAIEGKRVS